MDAGELLALSVVRDHGPISIDEWAEHLIEAGIGEEHAWELIEGRDFPFVVSLPDGTVMSVEDIIDDIHLTRRLTSAEIAADILLVNGDLEPWMDVLPDLPSIFDAALTSAFANRGVTRISGPNDFGVVLVAGTLADFRPGDLVDVDCSSLNTESAEEDSSIAARVTRVDIPGPEDLSAALARNFTSGSIGLISDAVWSHIVDGGFRAATLPISELIEQSGYVADQDFFAPEGVEIDAHREDVEQQVLSAMHGLLSDHVPVATALIAAGLSDDPDAEITMRLAADPDMFNGLYDLNIGPDVCGAILRRASSSTIEELDGEHLDDFLSGVESAARLIARRAGATSRAGALYVAAIAAASRGDLGAAEALAHDVLHADDSYLLAHRILTGIAILRSDFDKARSLSRFLPDDVAAAVVASVEPFTRSETPDPGRNDPCWCGSGRKYKVCHRGKPRIDPAAQNRILVLKCIEYMQLTPFSADLEYLMDLRESFVGPSSPYDVRTDPFMFDVLFIEGGLLRSMLEAASDLLRPEDVLLAQEWLLRGRSVFEVEAVQTGQTVDLRDVRTGDRYRVSEEAASIQSTVGMFICTRVVPEGDDFVLYGGIEPVDPSQQIELVALLDDDPTPEDLVELLSARFAPLEIVAPDGNDLVLTRAVFRLSEPSSIRRKLSRRYGKPVGTAWVATTESGVLGRFELDVDGFDTLLVVTAMSEPGYDTLRDAVAEMDSAAVLVDEERTSPADMMSLADSDELFDEPDMSTADDIAFRTEFMAKAEEQWLDESIPALGGRTPRTAVADPTTRDDVVRLLDTFPQTEDPTVMSGSRLKTMLGL